MFKTLADVDAYLAKLPVKNYNYVARREAVRKTLALFGDPQNSVPAIHIAGTSGKGSTAYYTASLLVHAGYNVGLTVSPHVNFVSERAQVNGGILPEDKYCMHFTEFVLVLKAKKITLTYIELLYVFAFWLFDKLELNYIVVEVGLGGRLDPTNVLERDDTVRVITDIGLDHTEILGDTTEQIAVEKAGIIHATNQVVMNQQADTIVNVVQSRADCKGATLIKIDHIDMRSSFLPAFQQRNWTLAHRAVETRLSIDNKPSLNAKTITESLKVTIPGRFECFMHDGVKIIIDVAHNPQKIKALVNSFKATYSNGKVISVVAFGANKESLITRCLISLKSVSAHLIITTFPTYSGFNKHALNPDIIYGLALKKGYTSLSVVPDPLQSLNIAVAIAKKAKLPILITGSFYLIDVIRLQLTGSSKKI